MIPPITTMKDAFSLEGKKAIITGGSMGMGAAIAKAFAEVGCDVAVFDLDVDKAADVLEEVRALGHRAEAYRCDVTSLPEVRQAVAQAYKDFGTFDILVNNAGTSCVCELLDQDEDLTDWYKVLNCDLNGLVHMTYEVGKRMRDEKLADDSRTYSIINMTSNAGFMVNYTQAMSMYSSAKAAANHFTHCMAVELAKYDIRVNGIAPGFTNTDLSKHIPKDMMSYIYNQTCSGRFGEPIEVAALAVYLASPASAQMTGHISVIDGGYILRC